MEKLTYYQICSLAAQGRFNEIPSDYNIVWVGEEPQEKFSMVLQNDKIEFKRNGCPTPSTIKVSGSVLPVVPQPIYRDDCDEEVEESLMDYGDVFIQTQFLLTELCMYYTEDKRPELGKLMNSMCGGGYIKKSDITFDVVIHLDMCDLSIYNILITSVTEGDYMDKAEFGYDWFETNLAQ